MRRRVVGLGLVLGTVLAALPACTGDGPEPPPASPTSRSAAPSPSSSQILEVVEPPEDFILRWIQVRNEMQNTGDTVEYRRLSPGCGPCMEVADRVDSVYADGGFIRTDGWRSLQMTQTSARGRVKVFEVQVDNAETSFKESSSDDLHVIEAGTPTLELTLRRAGASFRVTGLAQVPD